MTTINVNKITPGSGTSTALGESGDTFTIPAGVNFSNSGSSNLGSALSYCTTTKSASFTAVANKAYFVNTSDGTPFLNYAVTVASGTLYVTGGTGNAYFLGGARNMALTLLKGRTYRFTQSDNTNDSHPLIISTSNSGTLSTFIAGIVSSGVSYYLDGASTQSSYINTTPFNAATTRYIEFKPPATGTYYFGCYIHGIGMGGAITSQELTVTLPSSPTVGTEMLIIDSTGNASTNNIVIGRGGSKIKGSCLCGTLKTDRIGVRLIYSDASQGWITVTSANETAPAVETATYITATGGTITNNGNFKVHTFDSDATFTVTSVGNAGGSNTVDYVVVAGGAGAGRDGGGGGGAGGLRTNFPSSNSGLSVSAQGYPVTVGAGGNGAPGPAPGGGPAGSSGANSIFSSITSSGGGGGGTGPGSTVGVAGGSGGGGGRSSLAGGAGNTPPVSPSQGNNGGTGGPNPGGGGGGGGHSAVGVNAPGTNGGNGGSGTATTIPGSSITLSGGGGGSSPPSGTAGTGGAGGGGIGNRGNTTPVGNRAGTTNTGGGGGGESGNVDNGGGNGGSGKVVITYKYQN